MCVASSWPITFIAVYASTPSTATSSRRYQALLTGWLLERANRLGAEICMADCPRRWRDCDGERVAVI